MYIYIYIYIHTYVYMFDPDCFLYRVHETSGASQCRQEDHLGSTTTTTTTINTTYIYIYICLPHGNVAA